MDVQLRQRKLRETRMKVPVRLSDIVAFADLYGFDPDEVRVERSDYVDSITVYVLRVTDEDRAMYTRLRGL